MKHPPGKPGWIENPRIRDAANLRVVETYGKLPLSFEANQGQTDSQVKFLSRGNGYSLFLTSTEAVLSLKPSRDREGAVPGGRRPAHDSQPLPRGRGSDRPSAKSAAILKMKLVGANPAAQVTGLEELPGKSNYFIGNDPAKWRTNVPTYAKVRYENVYSGVNLVYYGNQRQLEYDFVVAPGADPRAIRLAIQSPDRKGGVPPRIDGQGDLVLEAEGSDLRLHQPVIYQEISGARQRIGGNFVIFDATANEGAREVGFEVARYDTSKPLIIDPVLSYSTYLGGSGNDQGFGIAVDSSGNAYVTGNTTSTNFPTANAFQTARGGPTPSDEDAFVTKLNAAGSALVYSTYLGGGGSDFGQAIAVDSSGNAYVTGGTSSTNFPTANALQAVYGGGGAPFVLQGDAFVTKLNAAGSALVYSTYLGGSGDETGNGIAVDSSGNAYVTGQTLSSNFPTANAFQAALGGGTDAFVTKLNAAGSALAYSTYLGGSGDEFGYGIALDSSGNAYVTGATKSPNFPIANALELFPGVGNFDAFVTKLNAAGSALIYSTYLSSDNEGHGIAVDSSGNAYVTGWTLLARGGTYDAFVTKLNAAGSALVYSINLDGGGDDQGFGIAADSSGNAYVTGWTSSSNFPTANAFQPVLGGGNCRPFGFYPCSDAFVTKLNASGSALLYSTYLGGSGPDDGYGIAVDSSGNAYVTGVTGSSNFPTANAFQAAFGGSADVFVTKFPAVTVGPQPPPQFPQRGVVNGASFAPGSNAVVAPGTIVAIFGTNLTDGTSCLPPSCNPTFGSNGRLNTTMTGAQVIFNGTPAPIFYSSPNQLGVEIPTELTGTSATVQVTVSGQTSSLQPIAIAPVSPGIFTFTSDGKGAGAITHEDGSPVTQQNPAHAGELVILYATGLGPVTPSVPTGALPGGVSATVALTTLTIDGITVMPDFAGLAGCCVGLNQVNVRLPVNTRSASNIPVVLTISGVASNTVTIAVQPSLEAGLVAPSTVTDNLMPPLPPTVPVSVPVTVSLTNRGTASQTLTAATPCDVHTWTLTDLTDNVIQTEPPESCIQVLASRTIAPGETITENSTVVLDGRLLRDRTSYKLKYLFWGVPSEATLVVQVVQ